MKIITQKQHIEKSKIYVFIPNENAYKKVFYATLSDKPYKNPFIIKEKTPRIIKAKDIVKYAESNMKNNNKPLNTIMEKEQYIKELKEGICQVTFTKRDGSERIMKAPLNDDILEEVFGQHRTNDDEKKTRKQSPDVVVCLDVDKKEWRSFRMDSVTDFRRQN